MKINQLVEISNVKRANLAIGELLDREKTESVGMGLFYGRPGLGKSRWAIQTAMKNGYYYMRLEEAHTYKSFLKDLLIRLKYPHALAEDIIGTEKCLYDEILSYLQDYENVVIIIDEIDYAFQKRRIIGTIRDFADLSFATFVLVGMEHSKSKLARLNAHYFDRCNAFCEFRALDKKDTALVFENVCNVKCCQGTIDFVTEQSRGTMRLINKYISFLEKLSVKLKKTEFEFKEIKELMPLLG